MIFLFDYFTKEEVLVGKVLGDLSMCIIYFIGKRPQCHCCYDDFSEIFYKHKDVLYHVFPDNYIKTDEKCPFKAYHSLAKCEDISLTIIE